MTKPSVSVCAVLVVAMSSAGVAQSKKMAATYITDEQVKAINALPGVDRQIVSTDIGKLNLAVGIIHRGPTGRAAAAPGAKPPAPPPASASQTPAEPCGERSSAAPTPGAARGIAHDGQTETYVIVSGTGTLVTGGHIVNGRKSAPDSQVTRVLNGPSCSGVIGGDVVRKVVKTGDIVIIPAGVPHGWIDIADHVDYLSVRPDPDRLIADYVNPALKK